MGGAPIAAASTPIPPPCAATAFSPTYVAVGEHPVIADFGITTGQQCTGVSGWQLDVPDVNVNVDNDAPAAAFDPDILTNADAGRLASVNVTVTSVDSGVTQTIFPGAFTELRATSWGTTPVISPTTITAGQSIHATGSIYLVNWDTRHYYRYPSRHVSVQWELAPGYITDTVARGQADSNGNVSIYAANPAGPPAHQSGYFRLHYGGNTVAGPADSPWVHVLVTN